MGMIRVSAHAEEMIRARACAERRTIVAVVDTLLDIDVAAARRDGCTVPNERRPTARQQAQQQAQQMAVLREDAAVMQSWSRGGPQQASAPMPQEAPRVVLCWCKHPPVSHRPKCLMKGCGCLAFREERAK
jgi:hypothetical protein